MAPISRIYTSLWVLERFSHSDKHTVSRQRGWLCMWGLRCLRLTVSSPPGGDKEGSARSLSGFTSPCIIHFQAPPQLCIPLPESWIIHWMYCSISAHSPPVTIWLLKIKRADRELECKYRERIWCLCDRITRFSHFRFAPNLLQPHKLGVTFLFLFFSFTFITAVCDLFFLLWFCSVTAVGFLYDFLKFDPGIRRLRYAVLHRVSGEVARCSLRGPPEACNQATGQLWGPQGGSRGKQQGDCMFTLPLLASTSHSQFQWRTPKETFLNPLFWRLEPHQAENKRLIILLPGQNFHW